MTRRMIDLSVALEDKPTEPPSHRPTITYRGHDDTWDGFLQYFPKADPSDIVDNKAWASEQILVNTHAGTHMDAPWHYHPTMNHRLTPGGEPSWTIDQVPLDWCFRPGVKLDFRNRPAGYVLGAEDVAAELARIGHELAPLDIVLVNTRAGALYGQPGYWQSHCGLGAEATLHLLERGVRVVGIDAFSWDAAFEAINERFERDGDPSIIWEGHKAGREIGYFQMEKLINLDQLPPTGFQVCCFPVKIKAASAAWTRVVAILDS